MIAAAAARTPRQPAPAPQLALGESGYRMMMMMMRRRRRMIKVIVVVESVLRWIKGRCWVGLGGGSGCQKPSTVKMVKNILWSKRSDKAQWPKGSCKARWSKGPAWQGVRRVLGLMQRM